jgi:uncharacterized membrane protein YhhN
MKNFWLALFIVSLVTNLAGIVWPQELLRDVAKPVIVISLAGYFFTATQLINTSLKKWILFALLFSWLGDVLLMFQERDGIYFLLGLSSFLIAHIFYIVFFHKVRLAEAIKSRPVTLILVVIYYGFLISFLSPYLGDMRLPVRVYGVVISFMCMLAMHLLFIPAKKAGRFLFTGALLFVISDSILAIAKFYQPFAGADLLIMLSYGLAQLLLTQGAILYLQSVKK